ncbi:PREDICTED: dolichyl-diphosphooligosaccharide--protein glycosyltransferase subunit 2 [Dufourea novaeangliae]|uniref:Dolichyl-diphosphooligosaccharide--protein glycosyltransferase subunit 2 n=1 Tax=Dufourea novaeangliae TaxID=178035 RepID=A0A154NZJ3_DUFNO|nr:PREDICTED: dolichyl-diphosphooligosaccharide--protein glycosyltransferase subunit 2 [Dufourea novaeangliae]KZC05031.1 Dolichyl-diphosphooligosaccharide--protein glycosyltransferase subunit 2 [Dufourea novaeangliae]
MIILLLLVTATARITVCLPSIEVLQSTNTYLTTADKIHLKKILEPGLSFNDVSLVYYAVQGYRFLEEPLPNQQNICEYLTKVIKENSNITTEKAFYIASTWKAIGSCGELPSLTVRKVLLSPIEKDGSSMIELYYAVSGLTALSEKLPRDKVDKITKAVQSMLRKDDNLWNLGYTFHIASGLGTSDAFAFDRVEDAIIQADEVDGQYLQFEGGLSVTSFLVNGIFKLSHNLKKKPSLSSPQIVKMANYLLSRRSVQTPRGVMNLLSALTTLASSDFEQPICVTLANECVSISAQQPLVTVKVCNILGGPVTGMSKVTANSATRIGDDAVILSKQNLQPSPMDKTLFTMNLMEAKPERGFYKISVTAGSVTNVVTVKVLCKVVVDYLEIGTGDADQTTQPKLTRVIHPEKLSHKIEADSQQKLVMRFLLKDDISKKPMRAHQVFVRLSSASDSKDDKDRKSREILFVAEPDTSQLYKFDMPVGSTAVNFDHQSGDYNVELIVGDAILSNPFQWTVATVNLKFPEPTSNERIDKSTSYQHKTNVYTTKPEIQHMFREPEKRPPAFVSNLFTGLCLAPVFLLLILWAKLGVNISNFPLSLSALTFHLGLGSIFVLFGIFWLKLNMFVTLRYLLGLGVVTFLAGNKMLSRIAHKHKLR